MDPSVPIAERYVEGPEFSVEAITHHGRHYPLAVTEKFKDDTTKVEVGHVIPARLDEPAEASMADLLVRQIAGEAIESRPELSERSVMYDNEHASGNMAVLVNGQGEGSI